MGVLSPQTVDPGYYGGSSGALVGMRDAYGAQVTQNTQIAQRAVNGAQAQAAQTNIANQLGAAGNQQANTQAAYQQAAARLNAPIAGGLGSFNGALQQQNAANQGGFQQNLAQAGNANLALARSGVGGAASVRQALAANQAQGLQAVGGYNQAQAAASAQYYQNLGAMQNQQGGLQVQQNIAGLNSAAQQQSLNQQYQLGLIGAQQGYQQNAAQVGTALNGQFMSGLGDVNGQQLTANNTVAMFNANQQALANKMSLEGALSGINGIAAIGGTSFGGAAAKGG